MTQATGRLPRLGRWSAAGTAVAAVSVFLAALPIPFSNIDEYHARGFAAGYARKLIEVCASDAAMGRFRPVYWALEGALGLLPGGATALHAGRLAFLAAAVLLQVTLSMRLGAGLFAGVVLSLLVNWSLPALDVWSRGGPAEAFAQPLALGCMLLALRARTGPRLAAAAALGLAACLTKETYAASTAAALASVAVSRFARGDRGRSSWAAAAAAMAQFAPAVVAVLAARTWPGSYVKQVVTEFSALTTAVAALDLNSLLFVLAACGAVAVVVRLAPLRASEWPTEDLLVLLVPAAALAQTLALGLVVPRYQLPLATALALLAARASGGLRLRAVPGLAMGLAVLIAVVAIGLRAYFAAQVDAAQTRADQHLREQLGSVLIHDGAARIVWRPEDVEQPLGALAHLELSGIRGRVQMLACEGELPTFVGLRDSISRSAPIVVSARCPGIVPAVFEVRCAVQLPGLGTPWPTLRCYDIPERAVTVRVR